jgi:peptidoglycan hydrolase-like protein with peptidoglycan-binding domain
LPGKTTPHRTTAHASQHRSTTAGNRRPHPLTGQQRLARLHLQPDRVTEIQQALIREGYLQGDANGMWDGRTHDAMTRYQTMYGFPATGLPEAKSLMKLGLGAHPLPPELDRGTVGIPSAGATQGNFTVAPTTPASPPAPQTSPPS